MKIINLFSKPLSLPLCNLINSMFEKGVYPLLWKREIITPIPKCFPATSVDQLRPISSICNFAKIADRILADKMTADMSKNRDKSQYGNEKGLSVNHYLIKMINRILTSVDRNFNTEKNAVILSMVDWSKAFER